jgi:hypothetical protein
MKFHEIGRHTIEIDDDGISTVIYRGPISADDMKRMLATTDLDKLPDVVLVLSDFREIGKIDAEARRLGAEQPKPAKRYISAYVGANFGMRVIMDLWTRGTNFLHGKKHACGFFDDYASGRAWLLAQREAFERGEG